MEQVGVLYAQLDELEARIAEREVDLYDSDSARRRAEDTRRRAQETHEAAFGESEEAREFDPPPSLKMLFREVAKRIHPDLARDEDERSYLTSLMARANEAYGRGDTERLHSLLDDSRELDLQTGTEDSAAELLRIARQMQHAERDLALLETERQTLLTGELGQLQLDAEAAAREYRDLLQELASDLRKRIADAQRRFELIDRQIKAHGR